MPRRPAKAEAARIGAVTTCKGRLFQLQQTLPGLMAQGFDEVVVVDFDCPDHTADWVAQTYPDVKLVRVADRPIFNASVARNLGAAAAASPWLLFVDADMRLAPEFLQQVRELAAPGAFALANPVERELWGTVLVARADFDAIGGYDEVIENWGGEDTDLLYSLSRIGRTRGSWSPRLQLPIGHDDALRARHHQDPDVVGSGLRNNIYVRIKQALLRLGARMDLPMRQRLYDAVRQGVGPDHLVESFEIPLDAEDFLGVTFQPVLKIKLSRNGDPEFS